MVLSYTTKKRQRQIIEVEFKLDGEKFIARKPKDSVMVYLTAASSDQASTADQMYATMQFINGCLTPAAQQRIQSRLRDWDDDLELDDLAELMQDLAKRFAEESGNLSSTGRPLHPRRKPGAGKVITPDGQEATDIQAPPQNRTARRTAAKAAKKTAVAAPATTPVKRTARALPR